MAKNSILLNKKRKARQSDEANESESEGEEENKIHNFKALIKNKELKQSSNKFQFEDDDDEDGEKEEQDSESELEEEDQDESESDEDEACGKQRPEQSRRDMFIDSTKRSIRNELSQMTFEEVQKLQNKLGLKKCRLFLVLVKFELQPLNNFCFSKGSKK